MRRLRGGAPGRGSAVPPGSQALCRALAAKVDHYFALCDAVRLDPRIADRALPDPVALDGLDTAAVEAHLARLPIAPPRADGRLLRGQAIHPAYRSSVAWLFAEVVPALIGESLEALDRTRWTAILVGLAAAPTTVDVRAGGGRPDDAAPASLPDLERLILYQAWILPFVNSFVSCDQLYQPHGDSLFGWGELVLDGRWFRLAIKVPDAVQHEAFTRRGTLCALYLQVAEDDGTWAYEVVLPFTAGMQGQVVEGMWGVFVEHGGRQRHARVRRLVVQPISMLDAIVSPLGRLRDSLQALVDRRQAPTPGVLGGPLGTGPAAAPAAPTATPLPKAWAGTGVIALAAGAGIALAAVTSALAYVSDRFVAAASGIGAWALDLPVAKMLPASTRTTVEVLAYPVAVLIVLLGSAVLVGLLYLGPVCLGAWWKLRRRDLGSLLAGSGWAMNQRLHVSRDVVQVFTARPALPARPWSRIWARRSVV